MAQGDALGAACVEPLLPAGAGARCTAKMHALHGGMHFFRFRSAAFAQTDVAKMSRLMDVDLPSSDEEDDDYRPDKDKTAEADDRKAFVEAQQKQQQRQKRAR